MRELLSDWLPVKFGSSFETGLTCFAGLAWALWTTRNKISIQKTFPEKPIIVVYTALPYIQKGGGGGSDEAFSKELGDGTDKRVMDNAKEFVPNSVNLSDVGVIHEDHDASHSPIQSSPVAAMARNYPCVSAEYQVAVENARPKLRALIVEKSCAPLMVRLA
jgi:hypothetical protein